MTALALFLGHPRFQERDLTEISRTQGIESAWREAFRRHGPQAPKHVQGDFAVVFSPEPGKTFMAVDRFARRSLCYRIENSLTLHVAARADEVAASSSSIDMQAIYDYFHFHVIPAPRTIFQHVLRLPAAHYGLFHGGQLTVAPYWTPRFTSSDPSDFSSLKEEFRDILRSSVQSQCHEGDRTGCFLSGGTDSSTVAGVLSQHLGEGVPTYSIGFDAEGYDEMEYARLAARHFKTRHHEYYVTPEDLVQGIPRVAAYYDQPFGNSSALPGFYCAQRAQQDGVQRLLAGDGGDELFGGNSRYAKQKLFHAYTRLPSVLRQGLLEPLAPLFNRLPLVRKLGSYIDQAKIPMPDRITAYGLLEHIGTENIFPERIFSLFSPMASRTLEQTVWHATDGADFVNQMLAYDWRFTLAENDLPKVCGTSALAGIEVGFPLLDERLVDFSLKLPTHYKVKGLKLRWFFKEALRGFLPDGIITKQKHGFGLPFGIWVLRHPPPASTGRIFPASVSRTRTDSTYLRGSTVPATLTRPSRVLWGNGMDPPHAGTVVSSPCQPLPVRALRLIPVSDLSSGGIRITLRLSAEPLAAQRARCAMAQDSSAHRGSNPWQKRSKTNCWRRCAAGSAQGAVVPWTGKVAGAVAALEGGRNKPSVAAGPPRAELHRPPAQGNKGMDKHDKDWPTLPLPMPRLPTPSFPNPSPNPDPPVQVPPPKHSRPPIPEESFVPVSNSSWNSSQ